MQTWQLPVNEKSISEQVGRSIRSPMHIGNLTSLGIPRDEFLQYFSPLFEELEWDTYDVKRQQIEFLKKELPAEQQAIQHIYKDYYTARLSTSILTPWLDQLIAAQRTAFDDIQAWRRRSVAQFQLSQQAEQVIIQREPVPQFEQALDTQDVRSWPRVFMEAPAAHVEHPLFNQLLTAVFHLVRSYRPDVQELQMVAHFMSVQAKEGAPGDNSPEGAHEDGADFIISALVVNRNNLTGGESQIIEQLADGSRVIIFNRELAEGEFIFQADTGEEKIYGNDLWHHVTPFYLADSKRGEGWRDIIGFDISIL